MKVFWVDSYYWGADIGQLTEGLVSAQFNSNRYFPCTESEIYSAIRNRLEKLGIDQSEEICGKIITVRYN